ncbi:hypothetical protein MKX03_030574 [Papaver bracteatum]|nr:hypothetical protein MKX03_030574 [Papaver bracteatum]
MAGLAQSLQSGIANLSLKDENTTNVQVRSSNVSIQVVDKSKGTHHVYTVTYYKDKILTTVTHTACIVDHWISEVYRHFRGKLNNIIVGLDIEWCRLRRDRSSPRNKVAILQLCLSRRCLIFQFSCCDKIPKSLSEFLGDKQFIFVGVGIDGDIGKLLVDNGLKVARSEDLGSLADCKLASSFGEYRRSELYKAGMKTLAKVVLNQDLPKPNSVTLSNWERGLSDNQIEYACLDALVSYKLGFHLLNEDSKATTTNGSEKVVKQTKATERTLFVARSGTENTIGFKAKSTN